MILHFLASTTGFRCFTPPFKQYSIWDDINLFLMLISFAVIWVVGAYYLMSGLKFITDRLRKYFSAKKL